jgi:hypothetical protein
MVNLQHASKKGYKCSKVVKLVIKVCFDFVVINVKYRDADKSLALPTSLSVVFFSPWEQVVV